MEEIQFKAFVLKEIRNFFDLKRIPEVRYNQFSFAGSCESAPTTYWLDKPGQALMLPQTRQILAEEDLIRNGVDAVWMMQTSFRDEPKVGDGRHCNQFLLCELEQQKMSLKELVDFEEEMTKYMITKALVYFEIHPIATKANIARLKATLGLKSWPRATYTDVIKMLNEHGVSVNWGEDFSSVEEQFICGMFEDIPIPVAVTEYPESLKYFNMYEKRDQNMYSKKAVVECCDLLLPFAGETFGSSRREVDGNRIRKRFRDGSMSRQLKERLMARPDVETEEAADKIMKDAFEPYFQLFDGGRTHDRAGFGMGVGRLGQFLLGSTRIVEI
jgi:aspartyl/asparaginyl-tRNA synthetase